MAHGKSPLVLARGRNQAQMIRAAGHNPLREVPVDFRRRRSFRRPLVEFNFDKLPEMALRAFHTDASQAPERTLAPFLALNRIGCHLGSSLCSVLPLVLVHDFGVNDLAFAFGLAARAAVG